MRWSIVRVIWFRELRDQLRDRRTIFMIAVLPILLYPLLGMGLMQLAAGFLGKPKIVGLIGSDNLPSSAHLVLPWLTVPTGPGAPLAAVPALVGCSASATAQARLTFPSLLVPGVQINPSYLGGIGEGIEVKATPFPTPFAPRNAADLLSGIDDSDLKKRLVDVELIVPPSFLHELQHGGKPTLFVRQRERDDHSRLVASRLNVILMLWKQDLKQVRLLREGLAPDFDDPFQVYDPELAKPVATRASEDLFKMLAQIFPFVLVMWSLAGALYPAVDLCAGEKERGTMETLLISPASREEIVWGKFLTIWVFSAATALLNMLSMGLTSWHFSKLLAHNPFQLSIIFWGLVLLLPLSAFFSAMCLSVGVYARSSKEGQYYLMPLFLLTLPLIFLTLAPGVELNPFYSMVPVTGVALLLQSLMVSGTPSWSHAVYFVPVLAPMIIYSWLALRWAIEQFQREEVLFREAERLEVGLWLKKLFRDKEALPSPGEALFCFGLILALRWLSFNVGETLPLLVRTGISHLAFVATPPLFMVLLLTTRPFQGLGLRLPPWWAWPAAALLGALVIPPISELTLYILHQVPALKTLLEQYHPLTSELQKQMLGGDTSVGNRLRFILVLGLLPALCEELAFRGFILTGLSRRFRPWTAILLSSFLFALYQMNVFQFVPHFIFGVVLALLVLRTGSVLTAVVFHLVYNCLVMLPVLFPDLALFFGDKSPEAPDFTWIRVSLAVVCTLLALVVLAVVWRLSRRNLPADWLEGTLESAGTPVASWPADSPNQAITGRQGGLRPPS